jgi:DNA-binding MarR family transcriptional regulator
MAAASLPASLGPVLEFMRSLWALDHALSGRAKQVGTRFGITASQRLVVRILGQSPGSSAGAVARFLHVHPSTLTPVLQQLVTRGLVRRAADPLDRRRAVLWLTARGGRVDAASASDVDDRVRGALERMAPSEVFHARRVMFAIVEALAEKPEQHPKRKPPRSRASPLARLPARKPRRQPERETIAVQRRRSAARQARIACEEAR